MTPPYGAVPRELFRDKRVHNSAKTLYGELTRYADRDGKAYPSQMTLADALGCSVRSVERAIANLRDTGWIRVERRRPGGPNIYTVLKAPIETDSEEGPQTPEDGSNDVVRTLTPPDRSGGTHPTELSALSYRYLENETPLAPAGALRTSESIEELEHTGFDPLEACGMFGTGPVLAAAKTPGARALAYELRESWARTHAGALPGDINVKAVAGQIASLMRGGVTAVEMRSMISLYCDSDGYQVKGAAPWKTFLARRHVLLLRVRTYAEALAAESDPDYWAPKPVDDMAESRRWLAEQMGITAA